MRYLHLKILAVGLVRLIQAFNLGVALVGQVNAGTRVTGVHLKSGFSHILCLKSKNLLFSKGKFAKNALLASCTV